VFFSALAIGIYENPEVVDRLIFHRVVLRYVIRASRYRLLQNPVICLTSEGFPGKKAKIFSKNFIALGKIN